MIGLIFRGETVVRKRVAIGIPRMAGQEMAWHRTCASMTHISEDRSRSRLCAVLVHGGFCGTCKHSGCG